jgi:dCTP deaminase
MILPYQELMRRGQAGELIEPFDPAMVNPASIDICIGNTNIYRGIECSIAGRTKDNPIYLEPGAFMLCSTLERLKVPLDCAMDLRLKSSRARAGYNHALAFWFDPGWDGIGTLEIQNIGYEMLPIYPGLRIGQIIYHRLVEPCAQPYAGRYQAATTVEAPKDGN